MQTLKSVNISVAKRLDICYDVETGEYTVRHFYNNIHMDASDELFAFYENAYDYCIQILQEESR